MKALICFCLSIVLLCNAAWAKYADARQLLFLKNHFSAGFAFPVTLSKHESHVGLGQFNMRRLPGFSLQLDYTYNFNSYFGITCGTHVGIKNFGYHAAATPEEFSLPKTLGMNYTIAVPFFSIPIYLSPRVFISKRNILQADVGGSMLLFLPAGSGSTLNYFDGAGFKRVFEMKLDYNDAPLFMLHGGISYGIILKSANIFKVNCSFDYGISKAIRGSYTFYGDDLKVGYGRMYSMLSSFEVGISYVFTRTAGIQKS